MKETLLKTMLVFDGVLLLLLGVTFIFFPAQMLVVFGFGKAPAGVAYIIGVFGCVYATMGIGTVLAARDPLRNVVWIQVAILRAAVEAIFGVVSLVQGVVTFRQAGVGILVPAFIAMVLAVIYPRQLQATAPGAENVEPAP